MLGMAGAKSRGNQTLGDMLRSLLVLGGVLAVVAIAFNLMTTDEPRLPDRVDYQGILEFVRDEYPYRPLAPESEPGGWRATSVEHSQEAAGNRWRLGFLTEDRGFVGLEQSDGEIEAFRQDRLAGFAEDGTADVGGVTWDRLIETDRSPDRALVLVDDGVLTIVRGTESYDALEDFASSLG